MAAQDQDQDQDSGPGSQVGIEAVLRARVRAAMRERDRPATQALRTALGAIDNASAVPDDDRTQTERFRAAGDATDVPRREVTEADRLAIVAHEVHELERSAAELRSLGQGAAAGTAEAQASLLRDVLREATAPDRR